MSIQSLSSFTEQNKIKPSKLKQFNLVFENIDSYIEVSFTPNPIAYKSMPTLVANDGTIYNFRPNPLQNDEPLSSSQDETLLSDSMLQTTQQEYISSSSSQSILESDDF
ncbi:hypothetical protein SBY92_001773 [Candida maltosa Xu316]